jgi:hypothetical protein
VVSDDVARVPAMLGCPTAVRVTARRSGSIVFGYGNVSCGNDCIPYFLHLGYAMAQAQEGSLRNRVSDICLKVFASVF